MVITNRTLFNQKMESLKNGNNAFAESERLIQLLEEGVAKENLQVYFDKTPAGCWIIPTGEQDQYMQ
ncbi:hypothetical protein [Oceanobacillus sp. CAU 1775]